MESIKCHQCGLVSWPDKEIVSCKRCGGPIWQKNDYGAGFSFDGKLDAKPVFSGVIKVLVIVLSVALFTMIASRLLGFSGTDVGKVIGALFLLIGIPFAIFIKFWFLKEVFSESVGWGLASIFLPFGALVALIKFWDRTQRPFFAHLLSIGIVIAGFFTLGL